MERLADAIGATHVGAEMDPSHLFWQGIDPNIPVNIEHEDQELDQLEGLGFAADTLLQDLASTGSRVAGGGRHPTAWEEIALRRG